MGARVTSEERREQLVDVALRQFAELGLEGTTRTSLAAELGVDRVIVHRLYPDLDDLFTDVLARVRELGDRLLEEAVAAADAAPDPATRWSAALEAIVREARANRHAWAFLFLTPTGSGVATQLAAFQAEIATRVIGEFTARAESEGAPAGRQEIAWGSMFLYQGLFGAIASHLRDGDPADDADFVAHLAGLVGRVVGPTGVAG